MSGKYTWKFIVTAVVMVWVVINLLPLRDTDFEQYLREQAVPSPAFDALITKAKELEQREAAANGRNKTFFLALQATADADGVDLAREYFPDVNIEQTLTNVRKKNAILLNHLLAESRGKLQYGLDLKGGVAFTLELDASSPEAAAPDMRAEEMTKAIEIIAQRVDSLGVSEPNIRAVGDNRIVVQLAGLSTKDNPNLIDDLKKPAVLEFRLVHNFLNPETTPLDQAPPDYEDMVLEGESQGQQYTERLFVKRVPEMTGAGVERAEVVSDQFGNPYISLIFTSEGSRRFGDVTTAIIDEVGPDRGRLAIVLDGRLESAPTIKQAITGGQASITGRYTVREAFNLRSVLNNPLDVKLNLVEVSNVGPTMAQDAVSSGFKAFIIGTSLTALIIFVYYTSAGFLAVIAMTLNVIIILGVMCSEMVGATLSMPGIAGIVLTLGMSVDSNILIFERMREETALGKNLRASLEAGYEKAFSAIFDANVTTLFTALIMIFFGTGPVKGFGITLTIGIFSTMFAALIVTRALLELVIYTDTVKRIKFFNLIPETKIDFMKYARPAFLTSWTVVLIGLVVFFAKGDAIYGPDFIGGDEVTIDYTQRLDLAQIRDAATAAGIREATPSYQSLLGDDKEILKVQMTGTPETATLSNGDQLIAKLQELYPTGGFEKAAETRIGASISAEIKRNALIAIGLSLVVILVYVALRFEIGYGVGAVVATVHDLFMTVGIFVLFGHQFSAAMVGAILLIVGYSINDTIVVFDRIREELQLNPNSRLRDIINLSLNRTLARTIMTGGTTLLTSITLYAYAGGAVNDIAFTLIIGVIIGTFSSVFIASPIFFWWHKGDRKHVEATHDITPKYEWSASSRAAE